MAILLKPNEILITDCLQYKAKEVKAEIKKMKEENPDNEGLNGRSTFGYINEWAIHALCYWWGIKRDHTKDADMQFDMKWYIRLAYNLLGPIARFFLLFHF